MHEPNMFAAPDAPDAPAEMEMDKLAQALVSVVGARPCALLVLEATEVHNSIGNRGRQSTLMSTLLPVPPQQAVSYARPKFDKWLRMKRS